MLIQNQHSAQQSRRLINMSWMNSNSTFWNSLEQVEFLFYLIDFQVFEDNYYNSSKFPLLYNKRL